VELLLLFKIPFLLNAISARNLKPNTEEAKALLQTKLIVRDEAPVMHFHAFQVLDRQLYDFTGLHKSFAGSYTTRLASSVKKHRVWTKFHVLRHTCNM
jgi:integrase